ncbi:NAD(P)/FAD-dependent oxidoreductase [Neisseria animalis]|uniref:Aminoacetone oxidase family FAD-binding enzyme n=1 Tax=Neisseria animalis TaxID=492 RepID=A0A5P3MRH0_NEIAN|nr:aminoacetone oxidase family FAD-binding enzyme [Neisseria animalis]QEY23675.1 aminoacetone oxidase family FAD-binding enzyme [Neisseria animalis]ROW32912.1 aminoacetone oxidase family FAD-binding enzyme [Neisseria animalis]
MTHSSFHSLIIGAGAAGMMAAARIGQRGFSVALIDHASKIGEKIRISGGGRCNFTNLNLNGNDGSSYYVSQQPRFVRHALSRFCAHDFVRMVEAHGIAYHEKHKGQLFCNGSAQEIISMLQRECDQGSVSWHTGCTVQAVTALCTPPEHNAERFEIRTTQGTFRCRHLIVATGGLAVPAIGATAFGYETAKQFGHSIVPPEAALVPLRFAHWADNGFDALSGIALPVRISTGTGRQCVSFDEDLLFRHKGLSGPAVLQISSYWQPGNSLTVNLVPDTDLSAALCSGKSGQKIQLNTALKQLCPALPDRLLDFWLAQPEFSAHAAQKWADVPNALLHQLGNSLNAWTLLPSGSDGHKKAEATRGGVNVKEINPKTMESRLQNGLYFIGEVMDITGWLGGYNFQWAWASAVCAAEAVASDGAA